MDDKVTCSQGLQGNSNAYKHTFKVGDWVKVPAQKSIAGVEFFVGRVIARTPYFFVVRSEVGGFAVSYTWTDVCISPLRFKRLGREEALCLVSHRLKQHQW